LSFPRQDASYEYRPAKHNAPGPAFAPNPATFHFFRAGKVGAFPSPHAPAFSKGKTGPMPRLVARAMFKELLRLFKLIAELDFGQRAGNLWAAPLGLLVGLTLTRGPPPDKPSAPPWQIVKDGPPLCSNFFCPRWLRRFLAPRWLRQLAAGPVAEPCPPDAGQHVIATALTSGPPNSKFSPSEYSSNASPVLKETESIAFKAP